MASLRRNLLFLLASSLNLGVQAKLYYDTPSCQEYQSLLDKGFISAFGMVDKAVDAFGHSTGDGWTFPDSEIRDLSARIFGDGTAALEYPIAAAIPDRYNLIKSNFEYLQMNFKGASGTGAFIEDDAAVNALVDTDVLVYCNLDRWGDLKGTGFSAGYSARRIKEQNLPKDEYDSCKDGSTLGFVKPLTDVYQTIQISKATFQTISDRYDIWLKYRNTFTDYCRWIYNLGKMDTDYYSMFDVTLVHEMTHAIISHKTPSPSVAPGSPPASSKYDLLRTDDVGEKAAYEWKNIFRLRKTQGFRNADSYAYFALGAEILNQKQTIMGNSGCLQEVSDYHPGGPEVFVDSTWREPLKKRGEHELAPWDGRVPAPKRAVSVNPLEPGRFTTTFSTTKLTSTKSLESRNSTHVTHKHSSSTTSKKTHTVSLSTRSESTTPKETHSSSSSVHSESTTQKKTHSSSSSVHRDTSTSRATHSSLLPEHSSSAIPTKIQSSTVVRKGKHTQALSSLSGKSTGPQSSIASSAESSSSKSGTLPTEHGASTSQTKKASSQTSASASTGSLSPHSNSTFESSKSSQATTKNSLSSTSLKANSRTASLERSSNSKPVAPSTKKSASTIRITRAASSASASSSTVSLSSHPGSKSASSASSPATTKHSISTDLMTSRGTLPTNRPSGTRPSQGATTTTNAVLLPPGFFSETPTVKPDPSRYLLCDENVACPGPTPTWLERIVSERNLYIPEIPDLKAVPTLRIKNNEGDPDDTAVIFVKLGLPKDKCDPLPKPKAGGLLGLVLNVANDITDAVADAACNIEFPIVKPDIDFPKWLDLAKFPGLKGYPPPGEPDPSPSESPKESSKDSNKPTSSQGKSSSAKPSSAKPSSAKSSSAKSSSANSSSAKSSSTSSSSCTVTAVPRCEVTAVVSGTSTKQVTSCTTIQACSATGDTKRTTITQSCSATGIVDCKGTAFVSGTVTKGFVTACSTRTACSGTGVTSIASVAATSQSVTDLVDPVVLPDAEQQCFQSVANSPDFSEKALAACFGISIPGSPTSTSSKATNIASTGLTGSTKTASSTEAASKTSTPASAEISKSTNAASSTNDSSSESNSTLPSKTRKSSTAGSTPSPIKTPTTASPPQPSSPTPAAPSNTLPLSTSSALPTSTPPPPSSPQPWICEPDPEGPSLCGCQPPGCSPTDSSAACNAIVFTVGQNGCDDNCQGCGT